MNKLEIYRSLVVLLPAAWIVFQFVKNKYSARQWSGYLFAYIWQFQFRLMIMSLAIELGWLQLNINGLTLYSVPIDIMLGSSILFGSIVAMHLSRIAPILIALVDLAWVLFWMPVEMTLLSIFIVSLASFFVVVPSLYLAQWTALDRRIYLRASLQPIMWAITLAWLLPSMILINLAQDWSGLLNRPYWQMLMLTVILMFPLMLIFSALYEFAVRGKGTGFPYDPPKVLVTSGVYRYVSNPMQLGIVLFMAGWGLAIGSLEVAMTSPVALMLFIVFKDVCNGSCQIGQKDKNWTRYQQQVRKWWPRLQGFDTTKLKLKS